MNAFRPLRKMFETFRNPPSEPNETSLAKNSENHILSGPGEPHRIACGVELENGLDSSANAAPDSATPESETPPMDRKDLEDSARYWLIIGYHYPPFM